MGPRLPPPHSTFSGGNPGQCGNAPAEVGCTTRPNEALEATGRAARRRMPRPSPRRALCLSWAFGGGGAVADADIQPELWSCDRRDGECGREAARVKLPSDYKRFLRITNGGC